MSVYLKVRLRRKDGIIEHLITGTDIWVEPDEEILAAVNARDFADWKDGESGGWRESSRDDYEYCLVNLRD